MAEIFAVAGSVVTVLNLIKYSSSAVQRVHEFRRQSKETPQAFRNLQIALPFIATTLEKIKLRAEVGDLKPDHVLQIQNLLDHCEQRIKDLNAILKKHMPTDDWGRWEIISKAIRSVNAEKQTHDIAADIMQAVQLFTLHTATAQPSAEEISSIVASDLENSIDTRIQSVVKSLRENSGSAITRHNYYNGQTHIYNNYYFNVTDSRIIEQIGMSQTRIDGAKPLDGRKPMMITNDSESYPSFNLDQEADVPFTSFNGLFQRNSAVHRNATLRFSEPVLTINGRPKSMFAEKETYHDDLPEPYNGNLPEVANTSSYIPYCRPQMVHGWVEPMESTTSLATSTSSRSSSIRSPSLRSPSQASLPVRSAPFRSSPTISPTVTSPAPPPRPGYFELEDPTTPSLVPSHHSSPHLSSFPIPPLSHARSFDTTVSTFTADPTPSEISHPSSHSDDTSSDITALSGSTRIPSPSPDPLAHPASLLSFASSRVSTDPSAAKRAYLEAIAAYTQTHTPSPSTQLRRLRSLVSAELGLSLVVTDAAKHILRAARYAEEAQRAAVEEGDKLRVRLDRANVKAREAKVREKEGASGMLVNALSAEAFGLFDGVAGRLLDRVGERGGSEVRAEDCNVAAQALLGCARVSRRLRGVDVGVGRRVGAREEFAREASVWVERGLGLGGGEEGRQRLMETRELVGAMLR